MAEKLKKKSVWIFWLGAVLSVIAGVAVGEINDDLVAVGLIIWLGGTFLSSVVADVVEGFAEMISNSRAMIEQNNVLIAQNNTLIAQGNTSIQQSHVLVSQNHMQTNTNK